MFRNLLLFVLENNGNVFKIHLDAPKFESPIPLANTSTSHEYHQDAVDQFLRGVGLAGPPLVIGQGAAVVVVVRDPSTTYAALAEDDVRDSDRRDYANSFKGFRILDAVGECIVSLEEKALHRIENGFMGIAVYLDPGAYSLAYGNGDDWVCFALPAVAHWTLQVYVTLVPSSIERFQLVPDLSDIAVVFDRARNGFDPSRLDLLVGETVRKGLLDGRNYVDTHGMRVLLSEKFENPMLGLYAAHLMLLEASPNRRLLETVISNTAAMLGDDFPDIFALRWALEHRTGKDPSPLHERMDTTTQITRLIGPPVLTRSWDLLLQAARDTPATELSNSPVFAIAGNLLTQGIFVTWRQRAPVRDADNSIED